MKMEPLNENELEWLDDVLTKYNTDQAILDVAELDGLITAVLSFRVPSSRNSGWSRYGGDPRTYRAGHLKKK